MDSWAWAVWVDVVAVADVAVAVVPNSLLIAMEKPSPVVAAAAAPVDTALEKEIDRNCPLHLDHSSEADHDNCLPQLWSPQEKHLPVHPPHHFHDVHRPSPFVASKERYPHHSRLHPHPNY